MKLGGYCNLYTNEKCSRDTFPEKKTKTKTKTKKTGKRSFKESQHTSE